MELGTIRHREMLDALRAGGWLHARRRPDPARTAPIRQAIRDASYVDSDLWRSWIRTRAQEITADALAAVDPSGQ